MDLSQALAVAKNSALQPFDRDRLFISLYESLRHRPAAVSDARGLCDTVVAQLIKTSASGQIDVRTIVAVVVSTLRRFDQAAATHYAAFHIQK